MIDDEPGHHLRVEAICTGQVGLSWGTYTNPSEQRMKFHPQQSSVVSHFRLADSRPSKQITFPILKEQQFVVYQEPAQAYELQLPPTGDTPRRFFELSLSNELLATLATEESVFLSHFLKSSFLPTSILTYSHWMVPAMHTLIEQLRQAPYQGHLKRIYVEAKAVELFLLQVHQLDGRPKRHLARLSSRDIDCLQAVKSHLDQNYDQPGTLVGLAKQVGINQQKLKEGFKTLFDTTVFGYVHSVRMQMAYHLLVDEQLTVNEVAQRVGYKNAHHFTAAFKRSRGHLPKALKG